MERGFVVVWKDLLEGTEGGGEDGFMDLFFFLYMYLYYVLISPVQGGKFGAFQARG